MQPRPQINVRPERRRVSTMQETDFFTVLSGLPGTLNQASTNATTPSSRAQVQHSHSRLNASLGKLPPRQRLHDLRLAGGQYLVDHRGF